MQLRCIYAQIMFTQASVYRVYIALKQLLARMNPSFFFKLATAFSREFTNLSSKYGSMFTLTIRIVEGIIYRMLGKDSITVLIPLDNLDYILVFI